MIKLVQFPRPSPEWDIPNFSPFCLKVETYLKMAGHEYQVVDRLDPRRAPKGKLPVIEDGGRTIADSGFIVEYLKHTYKDPLDARLTGDERATGHMLRRTIEENLYFAMLYFRWVDDAGWARTRVGFFETAALPIKVAGRLIVRRDMRHKVHAQGVGRHSREEIVEIARADLDSISAVLKDKPYLFGDQPTSFDAMAYGFIANLVYVPIPNPLQGHAAASSLKPYADRIRGRYFGGTSQNGK
jgi:glutathione S-transferase